MSESRHGRPWHTSQREANGTATTPQSNDDNAVGFSKMNLVKVLLFIFNIVFVLVGITLVGIGIWTAVDKIYVSSVIGNDLFSAASYMMIVVGVITIGICVLGIYCVLEPKMIWTVVYFGLLIFAAVFLMIIGIIAVVFQSEIESAMVDEMRDTLMNGYGSDKDITDAWDQVQSELECCAISQTLIDGGSPLYTYNYVDGTEPASETERQAQDSWAIYKRTDFFREQKDWANNKKKYVPSSCCIFDDESNDYIDEKYCQNFNSGPPTNYINDLKNDYLYYEGCYEKAKTLVMDQSVILIALGFAFAFLMIGGIFLTFLLLRSISRENNSESKRRREPDNL